MQETINQPTKLNGGEFLIKDSTPEDIFISKEFGEEDQMMAKTARDFVSKFVEPVADKLEHKEDAQLPLQLLEKAGELGLLGLGVPEQYGGFDVPFNTTLLVVEEFSKRPEFSLTIGVQTSIGIAPILLYGNDDQKERYLPKLITAEWKCCYCLTEPEAGSDANSGKTRAQYNENDHTYQLTGQKMWITNAGIADIFIVFAKVEDDSNLSAFIVEKSFGGLTLGNEEDKMGIRASSTRQVFLNNVIVPASNMLGERGQGFKIALNVLNTGRIKLAAGALGVGNRTLQIAINYAKERRQFGQSISSFGAIKHKIAEMASKLYALEALVYRTGNNIDKRYKQLLDEGISMTEAKSESVTEYSIECAINKVFGSEVQDFIADEAIQIYGGMGYSEEAPVARIYRDSRISRIFEGTNEINRMLIVDMMLKKAMNGKLDLMSAAASVMNDVMSIPDFGTDEDDAPFANEYKILKQAKKATLMVAGSGAQKLMMKLKDEQEILMNVADMLINIYVLESTLIKTHKLSLMGTGNAAVNDAILQLVIYDSIRNLKVAGEEAIAGFEEGEQLKMLSMTLNRFTKLEPKNLKDLRRTVADYYIN